MSLRGKKTLVTGSDGFIGSHLVERLVREGADVRAFCLYNSNGSYGWLDRADKEIKSSIDFRLGDIRDANFVRESFKGVEIVFHLAALIAIPYSYAAPESFIDTNIKGTFNALDAARINGCARIVATSTSEVYGTPATLPIVETHPLQGQSPYSASKIGADKMCEAFYDSYDVPVVVLRPFNTYGPRQSTRAVIPTILAQLISGKKEIRLGNLAPRRDLTFVSDTVEGFIKAGTAEGIEGKTIQLGTNAAYSVKEIFEMAAEVTGSDAVVIQDEARIRPGKSEVMVLQSNPALAKRLLGWEPTVALKQGLALTAEWVRNNLDLYDPDRYHR